MGFGEVLLPDAGDAPTLELRDLPADSLSGTGKPAAPPPVPPRKNTTFGVGQSVPPLPLPTMSGLDSSLPRPPAPAVSNTAALDSLELPSLDSFAGQDTGVSAADAMSLGGGLAPSPPSRMKTLSDDAAIDGLDLPAPKGMSGGPSAFDADLPAPKHLAARGTADLPAPKGFFDDAASLDAQLPTPKIASNAGASGLPAPKGFFDDAASLDAQLPTPKIASNAGASGLPAPKGFFDDAASLDAQLPTPKGVSASPESGLPAPKGFFDDVPAPSAFADHADLPTPVSPSAGGPTPAGFFDDVPAPKAMLDAMPAPAPPLDLDGLDLATANSSVAEGTSPVSSAPFGLDGLDLDGGSVPSLDLGGGSDAPSLELPDNSPSDTDYLPHGGGGGALELDTDHAAPASAEVHTTVAKQTKSPAKDKTGPDKAGSKKKLVIAVAAAVGIGAAGFGGFLFYQDWSSGNAADRAASGKVSRAETLLHSDAPGHWEKAAKEANAILQSQPKNGAALGIVAEANYAAAFSQWTRVKERQALGVKALEQAHTAVVKDAHLTKATALQSLVEKRYPDALKRLSQLTRTKPADVDAHLYLGWVHAATHDHTKAIISFNRVLKSDPSRIPALYGLAQSQLESGNQIDAKASFRKAMKESRDKYKLDHVGALLGIHQLTEVDRFGEREARYLAVLERGDIDKTDPRVVSNAWALAGTEALAAGRLDEAERRFAKSLELEPGNLKAFVGEAQSALKRGKTELAKERITRVLTIDPHHLNATLALAEVASAEGDSKKAVELVESILAREPKVESRELLSRAHFTLGSAQELSPDQLAAAEESYKKAQSLAPEGVIGPSVALASLYAKQGRGAEAIEILAPLEERASNDTATAVTLGIAFMNSGDLVRSERNFRRALEQRPGDVEATFQLGRALFMSEQYDEGIKEFNIAYNANETREDIGLELAWAYEQRKRISEAKDMYERLLAARTPSINARARAGSFYARIGDLERATPLGEIILQEQPHHPAGLFLSGIALLAEGSDKKARELFQDAVRLDPQPQYQNSLGLVSEKLQLLDDAIKNYESAAAGDKTYEEPLLGLGRVRLLRAEYDRALPPLLAAVEINPESASAYHLIGKANRALLRHNEAKNAFEKSIEFNRPKETEDQTLGRQPKPNPETHYLLGETYFDLGDSKNAEVAFSAAVDLAMGEEKWLDDAYYQLGSVAKMNKNRGTALRAWTTFLERNRLSSNRRNSVKREVLRLKAR